MKIGDEGDAPPGGQGNQAGERGLGVGGVRGVLCGQGVSRHANCRPDLGVMPLSNFDGFEDDHVFLRHVVVKALAAGFHALDLVHHVLSFDHFAEHGVAPALRRGGGVVEEGVVGDVDEKLRGGRMRIGGAGHGEGVAVVFEAVVGFVLNRGEGGLLLHAGLEAAALDHETVDHAVKNGAVEVARAHIGEEVFARLGGVLGIEFDADVAVVGLEFDHDGLSVFSFS